MNMIADEIKDSKALPIFKQRAEKWKFASCSRKLCIRFFSNLGYT